MRTIPIILVALVTIALAPIPAAEAADLSTGPWVGIAEQGDWNSHYVQNYKSGTACFEPPLTDGTRQYAIVVEAANPTDTLYVKVGDHSVLTTAGVAVIPFEGYLCIRGYVYVYGYDVAVATPYSVQLVQGGPGLGDPQIGGCLPGDLCM